MALPVRSPAAAAAQNAEPLAASVFVVGDEHSREQSLDDWRSADERVADYNLATRHGRRLHYRECEVPKKVTGNARKNAIRKAWTELKAEEKRKYCQRSVEEESMEPGEKSAIARYLRWSRGEAGPAGRGRRANANEKFINGKLVFLTYHADAWVLSRPAWNLRNAAEPLAAAVSECRTDATVLALQSQLEKDLKVVVDEICAKEWSVALELCPETLKTQKLVRLHAHVVFTWSRNKTIRSASSLRLAGVLPVHNSDGNPMAFHRSRSSAPGHYYLQMPKVGSIWRATNTLAFKKFAVNPRWVTAFWQSEHLTTESARAEYVRCKMNLMSNLQNLQVVDRETEAELLRSKKEIIDEALRADLCEFRFVAEKEPFLQQFEQIRRRYKFLVLHGASCTGKTVWAKFLFEDPDLVLEINCASCPEPDLREFRPMLHKGILIDEASAEMVLRQKKLFQAPPVDCRMGASNTNCHAYDVYVSGVAMMIASNTWESEVAALKRHEDRDWLRDNSMVVDVGKEPLWRKSSS